MVARTGLSGKSLAGRFAASVRKAAYAGSVDMPPPRSLGRYAPTVRLRRAEAALSEPAQNRCNEAEKKEPRKRPRRRRFFHRLRPPAGVHINRRFSGASVGAVRLNHESDSGDETRCGLKIPCVSAGSLPPAPPHSRRAVYRCHSAVDGRVFSFHARHSVPFRQFAPGRAVCRIPPFSPTAAPVPVTVLLGPTRKDTINRHWQQPLVTGKVDLDILRLEVSA